MSVKNRHLTTGLLFFVGLALTISLGILTGVGARVPAATSVLLVVLAGLFQIASVYGSSRIGRADPTLARSAVRNLILMGVSSASARRLAEKARESKDLEVLRGAVGQLSVDLSWLEEGSVNAVEDWREFHKDAIQDLEADQE